MKTQEKYKKEDLQRMIFDEKKSYREIGRIYGVSDTYIKKISQKLGISLDKRKKFPVDFVPHNKGVNKKNCEFCQKEITISFSKDQKYCSSECFSGDKSKKHYLHYMENQEDYCYVRDMKPIKPYFLEDQNHKCAVCNLEDEWNGKKLVFVLDHIDGNASNNMRDNLRLVCPNCDSQLDTFKRKNKNSARKERYLKNYKN